MIDRKRASTQHTAVAGLQWGDEGKGKIVDLLAEDFDVVVRYNGGANAGHTVVAGGRRFALHLVPCGVLRPGCTGVIGNGVVLDPEVLAQEMAELRQAGVELGANLKISDRAHVVMPYHKAADGLMEAAIKASMGAKGEIGTTGRGIGPCYADKATRSTAVRVGDLLRMDLLEGKLEHVARVKNASLGALAELAGVEFEPIDPDQVARRCASYVANIGPFVCDTGQYLHDALDAGRSILFEGANGFLLDVDHGTYPYVTSSNSSALGIYAGAGVPGGTVGELIGVVKAYATRVGGGPFPTEQDNEIGARLRDRGHEYGTTTGRPRRCGWLDLVALRYAVRTSGATALALTLLDVLAGFDELRVCTAYSWEGSESERFPSVSADVGSVEPVYTALPGFADEITDCRCFGDLPEEAVAYVRFVEEAVGVPVRIVSVGPDREQTIFVEG
jgi:adenylosuccinate synthase